MIHDRDYDPHPPIPQDQMTTLERQQAKRVADLERQRDYWYGVAQDRAEHYRAQLAQANAVVEAAREWRIARFPMPDRRVDFKAAPQELALLAALSAVDATQPPPDEAQPT